MRLHRAIPLALAAVALAGCTGPSDDQQPAPTTPPATSSEGSAAPEGDGGQTSWDVAPQDGDPVAAGDEGPAAAQPGDAEAASAAASGAVTAYFTTEPAEAWWPTFSTHLTPPAQEVWQDTDPRRVPTGTVEGAPVVTDATASTAEVSVPSSIGEFQVTLVRETPEGPWLVSYLEPPEGGQ